LNEVTSAALRVRRKRNNHASENEIRWREHSVYALEGASWSVRLEA
jgi:hypothetical protein